MTSSLLSLFRRALPLLGLIPLLLFSLRTSAHENAVPNPALAGAEPTVYLPLVQNPPPQPVSLIAAGVVWKYLDNGSNQGTAWREPGFDDSSWGQGAAQLGYGDGDEATLLNFGPNPSDKYITSYFRHTFTISDPSAFAMLDIHLLRDDGASVYLNGQEVIRSNLPAGTITYETLAPTAMGLAGEKMWYPYAVEPAWLVPGVNIIAVEVHQNAPTSSDVSFDLSLTGLPEYFAETIRFAAIGDYGKNSSDEAAVAALVKSWNPDFVITLGDNNYPAGEQATIAANIDAHYGEFIEDTFETTRFFPSLGNHDWGDEDIISITCTGSVCQGPYLDHFDLPGNERYYDFVKGPVHFFVLDSDPYEPDGVTADSVQAAWLQTQLANASAPWKIVYFHHAPYSSGEHGSSLFMQWPFEAWGASIVFTGHDHNYERLIVDGFTYIVNGAGGANLRPCGTPIPGSQICDAANHGAMLVVADRCHLTITFTNPDHLDIDAVLVENPLCH